MRENANMDAECGGDVKYGDCEPLDFPTQVETDPGWPWYAWVQVSGEKFIVWRTQPPLDDYQI